MPLVDCSMRLWLPMSLQNRLPSRYRQDGPFCTRARTMFVLTRAVTAGLVHLFRCLKRSQTFSFRGEMLPYFYHGYGSTWSNERAVEVAIAKSFLSRNNPGRVLEIGNTLRHYLSFTHDIVDKYEKSPGVANEDIVDFCPAQKYDLIVSISTMEHVGYDAGEARDPGKFLRAFANIVERCLEDGGNLLVTMPLGYRPEVDEFIGCEAKSVFLDLHFMKRISWDNRWLEVEYDEVKGSGFDFPYPCANAIVVGVLHKGESERETTENRSELPDYQSPIVG